MNLEWNGKKILEMVPFMAQRLTSPYWMLFGDLISVQLYSWIFSFPFSSIWDMWGMRHLHNSFTTVITVNYVWFSDWSLFLLVTLYISFWMIVFFVLSLFSGLVHLQKHLVWCCSVHKHALYIFQCHQLSSLVHSPSPLSPPPPWLGSTGGSRPPHRWGFKIRLKKRRTQ